MGYLVFVYEEAKAMLQNIPEPAFTRIEESIKALSEDPEPFNSFVLAEPGTSAQSSPYREMFIEGYRVVYKLDHLNDGLFVAVGSVRPI